MKNKVLLISIIIFFLAFSAIAGEFYYNPDGSKNAQDIFDNLVAVGFKSFAVPEADMFAQTRPYLIDDFEFKEIPGNMTVFGIEQGYSLDYVMAQLRAESDIYLVNPVIIGTDSTPVYITNQIVAYFNNDVSANQIDSLNNTFNLTQYRTIGDDSVYYFLEFDYSTDSNTLEICNAYFESGIVRFSTPNFVIKVNFEAVPNDPYFGYQWHLHNTGQSGGTPDADIDMPEALDLRSPQYTKRLAIIDDGFEMDHIDHANELFMWPYDCVGRDYLIPLPDSDPSPDCDTIFEHCYHGTAMLGFISPIIDNNSGLAGIMDSMIIIPIKFTDRNGDTDVEFVIDALNYSMTSPHNATVISCSWSLNIDDHVGIS
ncbi:MAG TPA: hypothetical protein ENO22_10535 [candidate division Zixibacteria bacterium]|nr:hypothetical protein [candidate division Zixibacteria bacterium]